MRSNIQSRQLQTTDFPSSLSFLPFPTLAHLSPRWVYSRSSWHNVMCPSWFIIRLLSTAHLSLSTTLFWPQVILSKDTTTSGGVLVDKHTGQVVKTDSRVNNYKSDPEATERLRRQRRLECVTETGADGHADLDCSFNSDVISSANALLMLSQCHDGNDVHFEYPNK